MGVLVGVFVKVLVEAAVAVLVGVNPMITTGGIKTCGVAVGVLVGVDVGVRVGVLVDVLVGVAVGAGGSASTMTHNSLTSRFGAPPASTFSMPAMRLSMSVSVHAAESDGSA